MAYVRRRPFCPDCSSWDGEQGPTHLVVQGVHAQTGCGAREVEPAVQEVAVQVRPSLCRDKALLRCRPALDCFPALSQKSGRHCACSVRSISILLGA